MKNQSSPPSLKTQQKPTFSTHEKDQKRYPDVCPLVRLNRGGLLESLHRGAIVITDAKGKIITSLGDPNMPTFLRSAAKPLQALPIVELGAHKKFGFSTEELACMCGSLNGEDFQVKAVRSILKKIGLNEDVLDCGVHRPSHRPTAKALLAKGLKPKPIHNNCAGKHAAMLALCRFFDFPVEGYTEKQHPVQKVILDSVAVMCDCAIEKIGIGIDGCGVPVFRLPLNSLATSYARLSDPDNAGFDPKKIQAIKYLMKACLEHPKMIAGNQRICTRLMQANPGDFLAKTGTEGSYALALKKKGWGIALQIEDGSPRALGPCVCEILKQLKILNQDELQGELKDLYTPSIKNHRGEIVADLKAVFDLPKPHESTT